MMPQKQMELIGQGKGMSGHHSSSAGTHEWITPKEILRHLGTFDLDPCAAIGQPWPTANHHFTFNDNGLTKDWFGRVWLNPPYGKFINDWMHRMAKHGNGIALIFARTETRTFAKYVWPNAQAMLFIQGRIYFRNLDGSPAESNSGAPSVLIAYGENNATVLHQCGIRGAFVRIVP